MEEGHAICEYKEYARRHFGNGANMEQYRAPHFDPVAYEESHPTLDTLARLEVYLKQLEKLSKHLTRAAHLRQAHYEQFLSPETEEKGHRQYREAMNQLALDAQGKLMIWRRVQAQELNKAIEMWNSRPTPLEMVKAGQVATPPDERRSGYTAPRHKPMPLSKVQQERRQREAVLALVKKHNEEVKVLNKQLQEFAEYHPDFKLASKTSIASPMEAWQKISPLLGSDDVMASISNHCHHELNNPLRAATESETWDELIQFTACLVHGASQVKLTQQCKYAECAIRLMNHVTSACETHSRCIHFFSKLLDVLEPESLQFFEKAILNVVGSYLCGMESLVLYHKRVEYRNCRDLIQMFYTQRLFDIYVSLRNLCESLCGSKIPRSIFFVGNFQRLLDYSYHKERKWVRKYRITPPSQIALDVIDRLQKQLKDSL